MRGRPCYWIAHVYANIDNYLEMFVRFGYQPDLVYHYVLKSPTEIYDGRAPGHHGIHVNPYKWYLSTKKVYIAKFTDAEFDHVVLRLEAMETDAEAMETDAEAIVDDADADAVEPNAGVEPGVRGETIGYQSETEEIAMTDDFERLSVHVDGLSGDAK